jgi:hypothetical protein
LLAQTKYEDHASLAEERAFLKEYTIPFVQLDPMKAILVFSHEHNTFDKRKMLDNQHPQFFKESDKTVDMFIRNSNEQPIKDFFLRDIDGLLDKYEPGLPVMKPDVLKQIKEIEIEREKMIQEEMKKMQNNSPIMLQRPGQEPIQLSNQDVVNMIQEQQKQIAQLAQKCGEFENMITVLQKQLVEKTKTIRDLSKEQSNNITISIDEATPLINQDKTRELEHMITMLQKQLIEKTKTIRELSSLPKPLADHSKLIQDNNELENMVALLQKQLIEKTIALRETTGKNDKQFITQSPGRCKSDPEVVVDVNSI